MIYVWFYITMLKISFALFLYQKTNNLDQFNTDMRLFAYIFIYDLSGIGFSFSSMQLYKR